MNNKISNPFLKQLISEIANNANKGRLDLSWEIIEEAKKKKKVKEADAKKQAPEAGAELPPLGGQDEPQTAAPAAKTPAPAPAAAPAAPAAAPAAGAGAPAPDAGLPDPAAAAPEAGAADAETAEKDAAPDADAEGAAGEDDVDKAKEDATKAKAELEKAKAEKEKAEKEIKKNSYVSLGSAAGTQFLLGKVLNQAFKTNTIDALAGEMVNMLKIETPEDMNNFSEDVVTYMTIPGMPDLISSMKTLATKEPETTEEEPAA